MKQSQVVSAGSARVRHDTALVVHVARVLNYSYVFVAEYGLRFLRAKVAVIVRDMISYELLNGKRYSTNRQSRTLEMSC